MQNNADKDQLEFTLLDEKYRGYVIEWASTPSQNQPTKWLGHFHAFKRGERDLRGSLVNLKNNALDSQLSTIRLAKTKIDAAILSKSDPGSSDGSC